MAGLRRTGAGFVVSLFALVAAACTTPEAPGTEPVESPMEAERVANCEETRDRNEALADQGDVNASFAMAELYDVGCAVPHKPSYAYLGYKYAAERGHPKAALRLGYYYLGKGVVWADWDKALFWFAVAERRGGLTPLERRGVEFERRSFLRPRIGGDGTERLKRAEQRAKDWNPRQD